MKKIFLFFILLVSSDIAYSQHKRFSIGLRSNLGLHGVSPPFAWGSRHDNPPRIDLGFRRPGISFSAAVFLKYSLNKGQKVNWNLTLGGAYDFSTQRKEWHSRSRYDTEFIQYQREVRIIHQLKSHQFSVPIKVNAELFKKVIFSVGLVGTRVISATIDRTKKNSVDLLSGTWIDEKNTWKADKVEPVPRSVFNVPFLTDANGFEGTIGFGYYLSERLIIGADLNAMLSSGFIRVYTNFSNPSDFYFASHKATVRLAFMVY